MKERTSLLYNRNDILKKKLNQFLQSLTKTNCDYLQVLSNEDLIQLKTALSDVHNILTLRATIEFSNWLMEFFNLSKEKREIILDKVNSSKPNSNGFDIFLPEEGIIAEIKCTVPINGESKYGAAQKRAILTDALKLKAGKKSLPDTTGYIKIIGLLDLGEKTDKAIGRLLKPVANPRTLDKDRLKRNEVINDLILIDDQIKTRDALSPQKIYLKPIRLLTKF